MSTDTFPCTSCGADLVFKPGESHLECPYCGAANEIAPDTDYQAEEKSLEQALAEMGRKESEDSTIEVLTVHCESCGAETTMEENQTGGACPFCGTPVVAQKKSSKMIQPESLLPFKITKKESREAFKTWIKKRWFAPNKVKKFASADGFSGVYIPFWTYDSDTVTSYTGQRGEYYYVTESYTDSEGKSQTRQVRKTRWYSASGVVRVNFDDLLVLGSKNLPKKYADRLEPWDLENLKAFKPEYLAGFKTESYGVDLKEGFQDAIKQMESPITTAVRRDIGGDEQRIFRKNTDYRNNTFKHLLLPVWISSYRYKEKLYRILINARTGEVQGERPYSWLKITLFSLSMTVIAAGIVLLIMYLNGSL